jgi:S1-C subfamily serine protease
MFSSAPLHLSPGNVPTPPDAGSTRTGLGNVRRRVTTIDWVIIVVTALFAVWGYAQGLIVGVFALSGFALGAFLGSRIAPFALHGGSASPYAALIGLAGALFLGGMLAAGFEVIGFRLRRRLTSRLGALDGLGGAVLIACVSLGVAWLAGAIALQTGGPRNLRRDIRGSEILQTLNAALPSSGPLLNSLAHIDPVPEIRGPAPQVSEPAGRIVRDPDVRAARASTVKVLGSACGLGVAGSGWIAGDGVVVTNAHVVAGQEDTTVQLQGEGPRHDAEAIWFDPDNDVAILRSYGVSGAPPLRLDTAAPPGTSAAILGYPENGAFDARPGRLGQTAMVTSQDAYGRGPIRRRITSVRGLVREGNSGGPMVDAEGKVVTTIFAATLGGARRSGFGVPASIVARALERADHRVSTGPCSVE